MCEILEPTIEDTICDVTAGTSGFLVGAYQYIITQNSDEQSTIDENGFEKRVSGNLISVGSKNEIKLTKKTFYGYDIDATMIRLGVMNLLMHNIKYPQIKHIDSLSDDFDKLEGDVKYTKILANPPFTGRIDSLEVSASLNRIYPPKYDKDGKRIQQKIQSEVLFLERIIQLLDIDGKAAVIVPEGVLFGSAKAQTEIRKILLKDCSLDAVISLPSGVFMPYTGVKTSIIVFAKKAQNIGDDFVTQKVWFYGLESDGYSLDAARKPLREKPLPKVKNAFKVRKQESNEDRGQQYFFVDIEDIKNKNYQLSYNLYRTHISNPREYEPPRELLERLLNIEREIFTGIEELKDLI